MNARPAPVLFLAFTSSMRTRIKATIEHLLAELIAERAGPPLIRFEVSAKPEGEGN